MERRPSDLGEREFDLVVVGGGILGACVARDATLRGLEVALVDRSDFGAETSSNSLKVIHGGLRHLQHLDLRGMRESVAERSRWLRLAPHLVEPIPVVVPLFRGAPERAAFALALRINDLLSADRNRGLAHDRRLPSGRALDRREVVNRVPPLEGSGARAGVLFYDAQMYSSERLVLSVILAAAEAGAVVVNHAACEGPLLDRDRRVGLRIVDRLNGEEIAVRARSVVNASGPGASALSQRLTGRASRKPTVLSLAWNLVLPPLGPKVAFALPGVRSTPTGAGGHGPRRLFVVPWRGRTLLGTGHAPYHGDPQAFQGMKGHEAALSAFLDEVNAAWPGSALGPGDAHLVHAGLLPAENGDPHKEVRLHRRPAVEETAHGGIPIVTARTVKFTTSRRVAEVAVDRVCRFLGHPMSGERARSERLPGAPDQAVSGLVAQALHQLEGTLPEDVVEHLVRSYGDRWSALLEYRHQDPRWNERLVDGSPVIRAQLLHGARVEMAQTVEDLLHRRTEPGARGPVPLRVREEAARILAQPAATGQQGGP